MRFVNVWRKRESIVSEPHHSLSTRSALKHASNETPRLCMHSHVWRQKVQLSNISSPPLHLFRVEICVSIVNLARSV